MTMNPDPIFHPSVSGRPVRTRARDISRGLPVLPALAVAIGLGLVSGPTAAQELTLAEVTRAARSAHPSVAAAQARVDAADQAGSAARAQRLPGVQLDANLTRFQEPMIVAPLHALDLSSPPRFDATLVQGRLGMAYTLFDGGVRSARIDGADEMRAGARLGSDASEMALLESVAGSFFALRAARAVRDGAAAQLRSLAAEEARARQAVEAGTAARVELLRAGAARQEAEAQMAGAEARVEFAERSLARVTGLDLERISSAVLADETVPIPAASDRGPSLLVGRAARSVAAAEARVAEERAARLPRLDAGAGVLDFGTLQGRHVFEWQAGVQLSWPLFTGGARSAAARRAEAELRAARADLALVELEVQADIDEARTAMTEADARGAALESAVEQWAEVARIEALALEAGSGVQSDLLRAEAGLFQARAGLATARAEAERARVSLARALGMLDSTWLHGSENNP